MLLLLLGLRLPLLCLHLRLRIVVSRLLRLGRLLLRHLLCVLLRGTQGLRGCRLRSCTARGQNHHVLPRVRIVRQTEDVGLVAPVSVAHGWWVERLGAGGAERVVFEPDVPAGAVVVVRLEWWVLALERPEVAQVSRTSHNRAVRRLQPKQSELSPVVAPEKAVLPKYRRPYSGFGVVPTEDLDELCSTPRAIRREKGVLDALLDQVVRLQCRWGFEGRPTREQLEQQHTQHPPVHCLTVARLHNDLRRHVVRSADHRPREPRLHDLGQPHVGELAVPSRIEQQIFRLEVPVDHVPLVQVGECLGDASDIEPCVFFAAVQPQALVGGEKFATQGGLKQEEDMLPPVVGRHESYHKYRVHHLQDFLLVED
mmetsp:Transcript_155155/g.497567  ORF Transcript_155155/g.497567 Transcript_155155/m.497567 type:complete len:369 (+) Transcript_155155:277-1383(+)